MPQKASTGLLPKKALLPIILSIRACFFDKIRFNHAKRITQLWYNHTMQTSDISYRNSVIYSIYVRNHTQETKPSLFDIDVFDRNGKDISSEIAQLVTMKKSLPTDAVFQAKLTGRNTVEASYYSDNKTIVSREFAL